MSTTYDVLVLGGGAAGLSAAMVLGRARRSVLVVDQGAPRNAPAGHVHGYLGREDTPPRELLAVGREEVARYGGEVIEGAVVSVAPDADATPGTGFTATLADGGVVRSRRVLVATGLVDELPDVPGLADRWGRDVLHCPYCHGWEVRDQRIGILGTGPLAMHQALMFRQWTARLTLFLHTAPPLTEDEREQLDARGVTVVEGEVAGLEADGEHLIGARMRTGDLVPLDALAVATTLRARVDALAPLGLEVARMEMGGHLVATHLATDPMGATTVPGVWAAGNVADPKAQVLTSAAAGLAVAAAINADLTTQDTAIAVEAWRRR